VIGLEDDLTVESIEAFGPPIALSPDDMSSQSTGTISPVVLGQRPVSRSANRICRAGNSTPADRSRRSTRTMRAVGDIVSQITAVSRKVNMGTDHVRPLSLLAWTPRWWATPT